jgi:hypothetical protein
MVAFGSGERRTANGTGRLAGRFGRSVRSVVGLVWAAARTADGTGHRPLWPGGRGAAWTRPALVADSSGGGLLRSGARLRQRRTAPGRLVELVGRSMRSVVGLVWAAARTASVGGRSTPGALAPLPRAGPGGRVRGVNGRLRQRRTANGTGRLVGLVGRSVRSVVGLVWAAARTATAQGGGWRGSPDARCVPWSAWSGLPLERLASAVAPHRGPWRRCPERGLVAGFEE